MPNGSPAASTNFLAERSGWSHRCRHCAVWGEWMVRESVSSRRISRATVHYWVWAGRIGDLAEHRTVVAVAVVVGASPMAREMGGRSWIRAGVLVAWAARTSVVACRNWNWWPVCWADRSWVLAHDLRQECIQRLGTMARRTWHGASSAVVRKNGAALAGRIWSGVSEVGSGLLALVDRRMNAAYAVIICANREETVRDWSEWLAEVWGRAIAHHEN